MDVVTDETRGAEMITGSSLDFLMGFEELPRDEIVDEGVVDDDAISNGASGCGGR